VFGKKFIKTLLSSGPSLEALPYLLTGNLSCKGELFSHASGLINSSFEGPVQSESQIGVGPQGRVLGKMDGSDISIEGLYKGEATAQQHFFIKKGSFVQARCRSYSLTMEEGCDFEGLLVIGIDDKDLTSSWKHKV